MAARDTKPMTLRPVRFYDEDLETLKKFFPKQGYNWAVRKTIHALCERLRQTEAAESPSIEKITGEIDIKL